MSLSKNIAVLFLASFTLTSVLTAALARAEESGAQIWLPECTAQGLTETDYCLRNGKIAKFKDRSWTDSDGVAHEDYGKEKRGKDIYAFFRGLKSCDSPDRKDNEACGYGKKSFDLTADPDLKSCDDKSAAPGMLCKYKNQLGIVDERNEDGSNKFHTYGKKELYKHIQDQAAFKISSEFPQLKIEMPKTAVVDNDPPPPPAEEVKKQDPPKDFTCSSSASAQLNPAKDASKDKKIREFLKLQSELTYQRIHFAFLNQIGKGKPFYDKYKSEVETRIGTLVGQITGKDYSDLNDAMQRSLSQNADSEVAPKLKNLLAAQKSYSTKYPQLAIGDSDMNFLAWTFEDQAKKDADGKAVERSSSALDFAKKVDGYIAMSQNKEKSDLNNQKIIDSKRELLKPDVMNTLVNNTVDHKVPCMETAPCTTRQNSLPLNSNTSKGLQSLLAYASKTKSANEAGGTGSGSGSGSSGVGSGNGAVASKKRATDDKSNNDGAGIYENAGSGKSKTGTGSNGTSSSTPKSTKNNSGSPASGGSGNANRAVAQQPIKGVSGRANSLNELSSVANFKDMDDMKFGQRVQIGDFCTATSVYCTAGMLQMFPEDCRRNSYNPDGKGERQVYWPFLVENKRDSKKNTVVGIMRHNMKDVRGDFDNYVQDNCIDYSKVVPSSDTVLRTYVPATKVPKKFDISAAQTQALVSGLVSKAASSQPAAQGVIGGCAVNVSYGNGDYYLSGGNASEHSKDGKFSARTIASLADFCSHKKPVGSTKQYVEGNLRNAASGYFGSNGSFWLSNCQVSVSGAKTDKQNYTVRVNNKVVFDATLSAGGCAKSYDCRMTTPLRYLNTYLQSACE